MIHNDRDRADHGKFNLNLDLKNITIFHLRAGGASFQGLLSARAGGMAQQVGRTAAALLLSSALSSALLLPMPAAAALDTRRALANPVVPASLCVPLISGHPYVV